MAEGYVTIKTELDTKSFDAQISKLERDLEKLERDYANAKLGGFKEDSERLQEISLNIEKTRNKLVALNEQKYKLSDTSAIDKMGKSFQKTIKNVGRLALAIFGIRSAYLALRRASSDLSQYDQQYAANLEYIRFVLTQAIAPVLRAIVQLAMQLLQLINMIVNALFGINLFANGSAESFRKMKAGASGVSKAVKEIRKQLTGFDEINILTEQSDTGTSGGAGGVKMPDIDLSKIEGKPPKWMKWLIKYGKLLISILSGIGASISALKIGMLLKNMGYITKIPINTIVGIGIAISGIVYAIMSLIDYLKNPTLKNFGKIIGGIGTAIIGIGLAAASVPAMIGGALVVAFGLIVYYWDQIKAFIQKGIDWLTQKVNNSKEYIGMVGQLIYLQILNLVQFVLNTWDNMINTLKRVLDGVIQFIKGVFTNDWKMAWEGVKQIFSSWADGLKNIFLNVWNFILRQFKNGGQIFNGLKEGIVNVFKTIVNSLITGINKLITVPFNTINSLLNKIKSVNILGAKPFDGLWGWNPLPVPQIPKLKMGGIINMPNKGTMLGGMAIGGESGREGVVPLTDQQAMAELGREIGKNVLVNLTNITTMNGRVLQREVKQITNSQEFAYNA